MKYSKSRSPYACLLSVLILLLTPSTTPQEIRWNPFGVMIKEGTSCAASFQLIVLINRMIQIYLRIFQVSQTKETRVQLEECTLEQTRECHLNAEKHPCERKKKEGN